MTTINEPEIYIFGENHMFGPHIDQQADLIRKKKPEYVLFESFDNKKPEEVEQYLSKLDLPNYRLSRLLKKHNLRNDDVGIDQSTIRSMADEAYKWKCVEGEKIPESSDELMELPIYEWCKPAVHLLREIVEEAFKKKAKTISDEMIPPKNEQELKAINDLKALYHFMEELDEKASDFEEYMDPLGRKRNKVFHAALEVGAKIAGCDIDKGFPGAKLCLVNEKLYSIRDKTMGKKIAYYARKRITDKPIITIVGSKHAESEYLLDELKQKDIKYEVIAPPFKIDPIEKQIYNLYL